VSCQRFIILACIFLSPAVLAAQTAKTDSASACSSRAANDTNRVVLADSSAPRRWDARTIARVGRHEVCVGMTEDMLRKSWGLPRTIYSLTPTAPGDTTIQFYYRGATVVLVNGRVRAIRAPEPVPNAKRR
jgi:hypothetical protein